LLTALFALSAAAVWGVGDFCGGLAARRVGAFSSILLLYMAGLFPLAIAALVRGEMLPPPADLLWGAAAGLAGAIGYGLLLHAFSKGRMGLAAPVSAVVATSSPVVVAALTEGMPGAQQLVGFAVALAGLWLLSRPESPGHRPGGLGLALLAGLGVGLFFVSVGQVEAAGALWPLVAARMAGVAALLVPALTGRRFVLPHGTPLGLLALAGVLDAGGSLFFLLATQAGRLDVATVLATPYPAVTALLAWLIAGERMTRSQIIGAAAAVVAIALITI